MAGRPATDADLRIAVRVRAVRHARGITPSTAALALGVSAQQFHKYENGFNRLTGGMIQTLAGCFGVPAASFFDPLETAACSDIVPGSGLVDLAVAEAALLATAEAYAAIKRSKFGA